MGKLTKKTTDCGGDSRRQRYTNNSLSVSLIPKKDLGSGSSSRPRPKVLSDVELAEPAKPVSKLRSPAKVRLGKSVPSTKSNNMKIDMEVKFGQESANNLVEKNDVAKTASQDDHPNKEELLANLQHDKNGIELIIIEEDPLENLQNGNNKDNNQDAEYFSLQLEAEENNTSSNIDFQKLLELSQNSSTESDKTTEKLNDSSKSESGSVEVVESTTPETTESNQTSPEKLPEEQVPSTHDTSKTMKDVKVQLNDCLKEENADQSLGYANKDLSFSKTLRTMSGRRSINRMRNITVRDRQPSPNSSLYVNTSDVSMSQDALNDTGSYRTLRQRAITRDFNISNGRTETSSLKRKSDTEIETPSKRTKSEGGLLNKSFDFLNIFKKSETQTTPTKLNVSSEKKEVTVAQDSAVAKSWCLIM